MKSQATKIRPKSEKPVLAYFMPIYGHAVSIFNSVAKALLLKKNRPALLIAAVCLIVVSALIGLGSSNLPQETLTHSITSLDRVIEDSDAESINEAEADTVEINPATTIESLPLVIETQSEPTAIDPLEHLTRQVATVRSGDSLSLIFDRSGFTPRQLYEVVTESEHGDEIGRLFPGREITFYSNDQGELVQLQYQISALQSYLVKSTESGYQSEHIIREPESYLVVKAGEITSSFYNAGLNSGLSDNLIMQLAGIFGWDIDFALEIRADDSFSVVYEDRYLDGEAIGEGNILAAEFVNQGQTYRAIRHTDDEGRSAYYTPEGESMRKAFLRTPLDIFWISSHFNPNRRHPILNTIRAHNGTDYAANTGTPVKSTGDGRIVSARYSSSYGNVIEIQHGQNYKTLYAHLNGFAQGITTGATVQQGQTIGYVGMTGLASGPHLHFEFYQNGVVRNPVTVDLPNGAPLDADALPKFKQIASSLVELLDNSATRYAEDSSPPDDQI